MLFFCVNSVAISGVEPPTDFWSVSSVNSLGTFIRIEIRFHHTFEAWN